MENSGVYLYGASGHAKVIKDILCEQGIKILGVFDDNAELQMFEDLRVSHNYKGERPIIISIGNNQIRKKIATRLSATYSNAIHPSSIVSKNVQIGEGSVIMPGAIINIDSQIGNHCIINTGVTIDHECIIDDYVHISPNSTLCGNVKVGEGTWIGAGSIVIQGVTIGKWSVVGAGALVLNDVPDNVIVVGSPAKFLKNNKQI